MSVQSVAIERLHSIRRHELGLAFAGCPPRAFHAGLELGSGDGYQSRLLAYWVESLISTDYNAAALPAEDTDDIRYLRCDAEEVAQHFPPKSFDLVYSSSLLPHVPDPHKVLVGIHTVLLDDGVTVHVMPNIVWKVTQMGLWPVARLYSAMRRGNLLDRVRARLSAASPAYDTGAGEPAAVRDNNPKTSRAGRPYILTWLIPEPFGVSRTNREEFAALSRKRWIEEFRRAGFDVVTIRRGSLASGYMFGFDRLRQTFERFGLTSHYIYVAKKADHHSALIKCFTS